MVNKKFPQEKDETLNKLATDAAGQMSKL